MALASLQNVVHFCCPTYFLCRAGSQIGFLHTGHINFRQNLSSCKCRSQMLVSFKSGCKQAVKKAYRQHIGMWQSCLFGDVPLVFLRSCFRTCSVNPGIFICRFTNFKKIFSRQMMLICRWLLVMLRGPLVWPWWVFTPVLGEKRSSPSTWLTFSTTRHRENISRWVCEINPHQCTIGWDLFL